MIQALAGVPLEMRVVNKAVTVFMGLASFVCPFAVAVMRHYKLDFESQLDAGFVSYTSIAQSLLTSLSPELLTVGMLAGTGLSYLWLRPRKRDVFWDLAAGAPPAPPLSMRLRAGRQAVRVAGVGAPLGALLFGVVAAAGGAGQALSAAPLLVSGLAGLRAVAGVMNGAVEEG
jgi:hypothetical protein